ncbi:MAG: hypothetical protein HY918_00605 [Candidatus Doudnabacteria bacterium]|nr:hypothetical protein [Candidatus Doudnabacteria bacterium]
MTQNGNFDFEEFDKLWTQLGREICQAVYINPAIQKIKNSLQKNGFLSLDEKSEFINICDKTKYDIIFERFGGENSQTYKDFSVNWRQWFQKKGVESQKDRGQRSSVDHILFGSTPDPLPFLLHFEEEMLGSMKK